MHNLNGKPAPSGPTAPPGRNPPNAAPAPQAGDLVRERPSAPIAIAWAAGMTCVRQTATPSHDPRDGLDE